MILPCFFIICLALCTNGLKLHEEMTKDEIHSTFNVPHDEVDSIKYEVTSLHHNEQPANKGQKVRRARSTVQFTAFDRSFSLDLLENDDTLLGSKTPLFMAYRGRNGTIQYNRRPFPMPDNVKLFHDIEKRAAIAMFTDKDNKVDVAGTIGHDLVIKPIPARLRKARSPNEHVVYRANSQVNYDPSSNYYQPAWRPQPITQQQQQSRPGIPGFERPNNCANEQYTGIMYPKILVAVDYNKFEKHGKNIEKLSKYMLAFWNSVDLIYREFSQPRVRLNIAGLIVPETRDSAPYFDAAFVNYETLDGNKILDGMQNLFANEGPLDRSAYDIAIAITSKNLQSYRVDEGRTIAVQGLARLGQASTERGVALAKDLGGFIGVPTAAHELGHSLNAEHDGYKSSSACPLSDGYIMSPGAYTGKNALSWSRCSRSVISEFLMSDQAKCMRKKPNVGTPYPRILAGQIHSRGEQCLGFGDKYVADYSLGSESCEILWCRSTDLNQAVLRIPADGTPCGKGSVCLKQQCVPDSTSAQNIPVGTPYYPTVNQHRPVVDTPYPTNRPGNVPSRDEQCSKWLGNGYFANKAAESRCDQLWCTRLDSPSSSLGQPLEEGSSCGPGAICLNKQCVRDTTTQHKPVVGTLYPTNQPGRVPSRDEQCSTLLGNGYFASKDGQSRCDHLWCIGRDSPTVLQGGTVAEGTPCGPGSICRNEQCV